ncbi:uncharacterized protein LOC136063892 [Quercus suber]|uniref:uncharacterized protein LOC136063892 n=1 Tax=Quercus suber TaxID=58331 RepID=UPI0032DF4122
MQMMKERMDFMMNTLRGQVSSNLDNLVHRTDFPSTVSITSFPLPLFIAKFTNAEDHGVEKGPQWIIHMDGSSNRQASEAGIVLRSLEGDEIECMVRLDFPTTNNEVEYEALVTGLNLGKTPFRLAYGSEAVIPAEVGLTSYRVDNYDERRNSKAMRLQLNLVDEVRMAAEQRLARYQDLMAKHFNSKVRRRDFNVGDLVLRKVMSATRDPSPGKLGPN